VPRTLPELYRPHPRLETMKSTLKGLPLCGVLSFPGMGNIHGILAEHCQSRASSRSQLSHPGSSTTMSAPPTTSQPVQSGPPPRNENKRLPAITTYHCEAQLDNDGPASGRRSVGFWGRPWKFFRGSFHALSCIPFRCGHDNGRDVQTEGDPAGGRNAILTTANNSEY